MHKMILPAAGILLLATTVCGSAAEVSGTITKINPKTDAITLQSGDVFTLAEGTEAETFKVGQRVSIIYHLKAGKMIATKIAFVK
jgi:Cu/Ag efflux protein CusF